LGTKRKKEVYKYLLWKCREAHNQGCACIGLGVSSRMPQPRGTEDQPLSRGRKRSKWVREKKGGKAPQKVRKWKNLLEVVGKKKSGKTAAGCFFFFELGEKEVKGSWSLNGTYWS